jgi:hypothetical protein
MKFVPFLVLLIMLQTTLTIFNFSNDSSLDQWQVVNDGVMGGRSQGYFSISKEGYGLFQGTVSLENNGGFSLVQHRFKPLNVTNYRTIMIKLKGDGKEYQVRIKKDKYDYYSYASNVATSGEWQTIEIPFDKMIPQFRGRRLNMPKFSGEQLEEIAILIGNKKAEDFDLQIASISLK